MKAGIMADPDLVGREREIEDLMHSLDSVMGGKGATIFIAGEAGSGKSRLVGEFLKLAKERDVLVLSSWCLSDVAIPYLPFMQAFDAYFDQKKRESQEPLPLQQPQNPLKDDVAEADIKAWLAGPKQIGKSSRLEFLTPQGWKDLTLSAVTKTLLSMSEKKPVILFIDDLHWADSVSLSLLNFVSRSTISSRILVIGTYRSEELTADIEGQPHPLLETLRLMRREIPLKEIKLKNLNRANVLELAKSLVDGNIHSDLLGRLADESDGNPLFVIESLKMLVENGSLVQEDGCWRLIVDNVGIPDRVRDIVLRRVGLLNPNQRRLLDFSSAIGEKFDVDLLIRALGQDSIETLETLNSVTQATSLISLNDNLFSFDHSKSREVVYEEVPLPLKRAYHARIAKALEASKKADGALPVSDLAYHYAKAGNKEQAARYSLAAGKDALNRFSNAEAIKHYTYVLESYSEGSGFADERLNALEGLGDAYMGSGLLGEGAKAYDRLGREAESDTLKLRALRKAMFILFWRGDFTSSMQRAEEATPFSDGNRLEYARILVWKARVAGRLGNKEEAQKILLEAINIFDSEGSQGDFLRSGVEIAIFQASFGKIKDSLAILMVVANAFNAIGELRGEMYALTHLGAYLTLSSQLNEALDKEAAAIKIGERILDHQMTAWPHYFSGMIYEIKGNIKFFSLLRGFMMNTARKPSDLFMSAFFEESPEIRSNYELAVDYGLKGAECAEKADAHYIQFLCYGNLVRAYAHLGDLESAENFLGKLKQLIPKVESSGDKELLAGGIESEAVFLSEKRLWEKANLCFEKCIEMYQSKSEHLTLGTTMSFHTRARGEYGWCLVQQNKFADAVKQFMEIQKSWENAWSKASFVHSDVQTFMTIPREIGSGEKFSVFLNFANVAQASCRLLKIDGFVPQEFRVVSKPAFCSVQKDAMDLNSKVAGPFKVVSARVDLVASKPSVFNLSPQLTYEDDSGTTRTSKINEITLTVRPVLRAKIGEEEVSVHVLPGRVSTGFNQLDVLLLGGIPENYAMILSSPAIDEKELLIKSFLEEGAKSGEPTFLLATDAGYAKNLAETHPSSFTVFVCGPEERAVNQMSTRLHILKGAENLTDIDIALTRFFRTLNPKSDGPRRACIDIVSDVLLQHRALNTRKWLNDLINTLKSNGFTTLAVINPQMHPQEEVHAILGLFDGEIKINEKETDKGTERTLRVRRLKNQRYLENELSISRKNL